MVASHHEVETYNHNLDWQARVSNPLLVGLHEVHQAVPGRLWVTSTSIDAAFEIGLDSGEVSAQYWPRDAPELQAALGITATDIDKDADQRTAFLSSDHTAHPSHLHLNAACQWRGDMYVLLNRFGVVVNARDSTVVIRDDALRGGHNLMISDDGLAFVNATKEHSVRIYDLPTGSLRRVVRLAELDWVRPLLHRRSSRVARVTAKARRRSGVVADAVFVRGMDVQGDRIFVGISPASILCVDWTTGKMVDAYRYSDDVRACVHGLRLVPVSDG